MYFFDGGQCGDVLQFCVGQVDGYWVIMIGWVEGFDEGIG